MGRVIAMANTKGGTGKTVTAVALAHLFGADGAKVALLDLDRQASAIGWATRAEREGHPLAFTALQLAADVRPASIPRLATDHAKSADLLVIDTGPGDTDRIDAAAEVAEAHGGLVVIPSGPSEMDIPRAIVTAHDLIGERGDPHVLLTRTREGTRSRVEMRQVLVEAGVNVLAAEIPLRESIQMAPGRPIREDDDLATAYRAAAGELLALVAS